MHDKYGAILIDSKKTWKLMCTMDKDLKKIPYKEIKDKIFLVGDDTEDEFTFITAAEFGRKYNQIGTIIMHMATKK